MGFHFTFFTYFEVILNLPAGHDAYIIIAESWSVYVKDKHGGYCYNWRYIKHIREVSYVLITNIVNNIFYREFYILTRKRNVTKYRCNLFHRKKRKIQIVVHKLNVECERGNLFTKFGFPAKHNGIDESSIKWGKITK